MRSLARRGTRDHVIAIDSANKNRHSYTIQPILGRDGRLRGKLLICFYEGKEAFGVDVDKKVKALEREVKNVRAFASKAGKMSRNSSMEWLDRVLVPEIARLSAADAESISSQDSQRTELAGPSWASNPPASWTPEQHRIMELRNSNNHSSPGVLLLLDSWGGHSSESLVRDFDSRNIFVLRIPPRTTDELQPQDVQLFRQVKIFVKRITEAASYEGILRNLTDRYGIMRMQSLIWNQFRAPIYRDMLLWSWRHTDPDFDPDELEHSPPPDMVINIQFKFERRHKCDVPGCSTRTFIKCAHCGKHLCLKHFLARQCFHEDEDENASLDYGNHTSTMRPPLSRHDHDDEGSAGAAALTGGAGAAAIGAAITGSAVGAGGAALSTSVASGAAIETGAVMEQIVSRTSSNAAADTIPLLHIPENLSPEEVLFEHKQPSFPLTYERLWEIVGL